MQMRGKGRLRRTISWLCAGLLLLTLAVYRYQTAPLLTAVEFQEIAAHAPEVKPLTWPGYGQAAVATRDLGIVATHGETAPQSTPPFPVTPLLPDALPITPTDPPWYFPIDIPLQPSIKSGISTSPDSGIVKLNIFSEYVSSQPHLGKELDMHAGQVVHFDARSALYSITISEITSGSVTFTPARAVGVISSKSITPNDGGVRHTLRVGASGEYSVEHDTVSDIRITVLAIKDGVAMMRFKELIPPIMSRSFNAALSHHDYWIWTIVVILALVIIRWLVVTHRHQEAES